MDPFATPSNSLLFFTGTMQNKISEEDDGDAPPTPNKKLKKLSQLSPDGKLLQKYNHAEIAQISRSRQLNASGQALDDPFLIQDCDLLLNNNGDPKPNVKFFFKRISLGPFYLIWTANSRNEGTCIMQLNPVIIEDSPESDAFRSITGIKAPPVNRRLNFDTNKTLKQKPNSSWGWKAIICWNHSNAVHGHFILNTLHHLGKCLNYRAPPGKQNNCTCHLTASDQTNFTQDTSLDKLITDHDVRKVIYYYFYYPYLINKYWNNSKQEYQLPVEITSRWHVENPAFRSFFFSSNHETSYSKIAHEFGYFDSCLPAPKKKIAVKKIYV